MSLNSVELTAEDITTRPFSTRDFEAVGDVRAVYDDTELLADRLSGNAETLEVSADRARVRIGQKRIQGQEIFTKRIPIDEDPGYSLEYVVREGMFTTCDLERPDYRVTAREITLRPNEYVSARRVSVWLGRTRILSVPALKVRMGPDRRETFLPRPGYSADDGAFLAFSNALVATPRTDVRLRLRATTRNGLQGGVTLERALHGPLVFNTIRALELEDRPLLAPTFDPGDASCPISVQTQAFPTQLLAYGRLLRRERIFDPEVRDLRLDASPEVGVRWISTPFRLTDSISAYAAAQTSWGRFDEFLGDGSSASGSRADLRMSLSALPMRVGGGMFFQPAVALRYSDYEGREDYRSLGFSADVARVFGRSYIAARYSSYRITGTTPFEFDDIDRRRELQASLQYCGAGQGIGLLLWYAFDDGGLYDWELSYSRRLHCLEPTFTWRNRFKMFSVDVRVLGFD